MHLRPIATRYRPLAWLLAIFLLVTTGTRAVLLVAAGAGVPMRAGYWLAAFGLGLGYDLLTFVYFAWPMVLLLWVLPRRWFAARTGRWSSMALGWVLVAVTLFVAVAEWTFWAEFQTRFNFIAVDYLVYTTEVIGNIRESYPVPAILSVLFVLVTALCWWGRRWLLPRADGADTGFGQRSLVTLGWLAVTVLGTWLVSADLKDRTDNAYVNELAGNGMYQFFAAYRNAGIDYSRFYRTEPVREAFVGLRPLLQARDATFVSVNPYDITRRISAHRPLRKLNVVLLTVESLSPEYSRTYGGKENLTPELDKLTAQSLLFTNLYATGTRTVRGLEALALSVPPTPGESIVKRPNNEGLFSLAAVFNRQGYVSEFLYGGYGAFDNMNYFFANNGYVVKDRTNIPNDNLQVETVWGVADEDLYTMALKEFDRISGSGKPFFAQVLPTSNHRPYVFPKGRVNMPQRQRKGAVAYTDWAIGDFLRRARTRPWFSNTVFMIVSDHTASSGGIAALPTFRYRIPAWLYAPGLIAPGRVERRMSQIDIPPTLLGLLGMNYTSRFYGQDMFDLAPRRDRVFIGNYQKLGYLKGDRLVQLGPKRTVEEVRPAFNYDQVQPAIALEPKLVEEAVHYYQTASYRFQNGMMKDIEQSRGTSKAR